MQVRIENCEKQIQFFGELKENTKYSCVVLYWLGFDLPERINQLNEHCAFKLISGTDCRICFMNDLVP